MRDIEKILNHPEDWEEYVKIEEEIVHAHQRVVGEYKMYMDDKFITETAPHITDMCWGILSCFLTCELKDRFQDKFKTKLRMEIENGFPSTLREMSITDDGTPLEKLKSELTYWQEAEDNFSPSIKGGMGVMFVTNEIEKFTSLFIGDMKKLGVNNWDTRMNDLSDNPITAINVIISLTTQMLEPLD